MSKSNTFENEFLLHTFQNANIADIGDATGLRGSTAAGSLYYALHTADPGEAGVQNTSECAYTGYARVAKARTSGNFTVTGNSVSPAADVDFPPATGGIESATHFSVGVAASGATKILYKGPLNPAISIANGVTPRIGAGTTIVED